jgi:hypothetical protein
VGVFPDELFAEAAPLAGLSLSLTLLALFWAAGGVLACTGGGLAAEETDNVEPRLVMPPEEPTFFLVRVLEPPTGRLEPEPRFRFLMTSVFKLSGRTTP